MARQRAVPRKAPVGNPVEAEVYPYYPAHTVNHEYEADGKVDKNEDDGCSKDYNECATFTGGITHITCSHSIVKGVYGYEARGICQNDCKPLCD